MSFNAIRHTLFTVHMWIGLILGVLLAVLGLSGSLLVYDDIVSDWISPPPHATTAGQPLPLSMVAGIARDAAAEQGLGIGTVQIVVPEKRTDAMVIRFNGISRMGAQPGQAMREGGRRGYQMYIDPVSGEVLGGRAFVQPGLLTFAHQLHGNFLMGREGRRFVGWLGVAMCLLGVSGLVLWWPKRGQWKYAFKVRRAASGLRFHRELHAATGIWIFIIFMVVSFSGVVIAWPQTLGLNAAGPVQLQTAEPQPGKMLGATEAVIAATAAVPDLKPRTVTIPGRPGQPITVNYLSNGAINAVVLVDSTTGKVLLKRDNSDQFLAWMRPVHDGTLGAVWRFLVFLSGLVPTLFVVTGSIMWWKKRQRQVPMTAMTEDLAGDEAAA